MTKSSTRKLVLAVLSAAVATLVIRAADWPSQSGNPQREAWAKTEKAFTKENAKGIELLYKYKADNQARGLSALTSPVVNGLLITYLGFKEMLVFGGSSDNVYSMDADLNRLIWKTHFDYKGDKAAAPTAVCPGGLTAAMAMPGSSTAMGRGFGAPPGRGVAGRGPGAPGTPAAPGAAPGAVPGAAPGAGRGPTLPPGFGPPPPGRAGLFSSGFGRSGVFLAVSGDGYLHALNTSTGTDKESAVKFLPANATASALNVNDGIVYAATQDGCGGKSNALYAIEAAVENGKVSTFETHGAGFAGVGGTAIGTDGTAYAQAVDGQGDGGPYSDTVLALSKDLKVKDYFTPSDAPAATKKDVTVPGITPVVFEWNGRDLIVAGSRNGRVYVLDSKSLGGADHRTPLAQSDVIASPDAKYAGNGFAGTFSSWEDTDNKVRWIYASLWGPAAGSAKFGTSNGDAGHGSIVAFKLEDQDGKPVLTPAWISRDMMAPAPSVTANGLVFALSTGQSSREAKEDGKPYSLAEREKMATRAVVYALDGATGKELYSTGNMTSTFSHGSGLAIANRRIYFTTHDNTVYALGFIAEQPQLTGK
jgi:outer membrane protein assembly factor BamB